MQGSFKGSLEDIQGFLRALFNMYHKCIELSNPIKRTLKRTLKRALHHMHMQSAICIVGKTLKEPYTFCKEPSKRALHHMHTQRAIYILKKTLNKTLYILKRVL